MSRAKRLHIRRNRYRRKCNRGDATPYRELFGRIAWHANADRLLRAIRDLQARIDAAPKKPTSAVTEQLEEETKGP